MDMMDFDKTTDPGCERILHYLKELSQKDGVLKCGTEEARSRKRPLRTFLPWLASDGSLFWISGKASSGKSTLMQHLHENSGAIRKSSRACKTSVTVAAFSFVDEGTGVPRGSSANVNLEHHLPLTLAETPMRITYQILKVDRHYKGRLSRELHQVRPSYVPDEKVGPFIRCSSDGKLSTTPSFVGFASNPRVRELGAFNPDVKRCGNKTIGFNKKWMD
ncbi:uncharacterized protein BCR38DRAFT_408827 [Pseudomassariella vexata]|uniref:Nephrocystin 3-like N-terminal domain-containing protein n=1 Tax=Pseudomassariella vexata TaxID=1141098 RepID=A0A1Y2E0L6_9PEZI|nr:uncharacterized protein BCR38DRAFT_408827 [Pseudomassariella vexata]ORY65083.1 hypothetical protein BCR38DRAFT_408827 [Pseudomassariella vexata]